MYVYIAIVVLSYFVAGCLFGLYLTFRGTKEELDTDEYLTIIAVWPVALIHLFSDLPRCLIEYGLKKGWNKWHFPKEANSRKQ